MLVIVFITSTIRLVSAISISTHQNWYRVTPNTKPIIPPLTKQTLLLSLLYFKRSKATSCIIFGWTTQCHHVVDNSRKEMLCRDLFWQIIQKCASDTLCSFCSQTQWTVKTFCWVEQHQLRFFSGHCNQRSA